MTQKLLLRTLWPESVLYFLQRAFQGVCFKSCIFYQYWLTSHVPSIRSVQLGPREFKQLIAPPPSSHTVVSLVESWFLLQESLLVLLLWVAQKKSMSASHHSHPIQLANPFNLSALLHLPESNIIWLHCDKVTVNVPWHVNNWSWIQPPVQHTAGRAGQVKPSGEVPGAPH